MRKIEKKFLPSDSDTEDDELDKYLEKKLKEIKNENKI